MKSALIFWAALMLTVVGCGDETGGDDGADAGMPDAAMGAGWDALDFDGRLAYMAQTVLPEMKPIFAGYDAQYEDSFGCATCHGSDLSTYAMPSDISPLSADELATFTFAGEGRQEIADYMLAEILPKMVELIDAEQFDPNTGMGFGCAGCHPIQ